MHNMAAANTGRQLGITNRKLSKNTEKLSSGYRINRAADDAAGLSISEKMRAQIRGLNRACRNTEDGISLIRTADGALNEVHEILHRIRELSVRSANDTLTDDDRLQTQYEIEYLCLEIDHVAKDSEFNTIKLFRPGRLTETGGSTVYKNMDIVFCVDATGSMSGMIKNVEENIDNFVDALKGKGVNTKLGLVVYRDISISEELETYSFFDSTESFKQKLSSIMATGGGDEPESGLEAIMDGALKMKGRKNADRHFILVTDAPVHTQETKKSQYTIDEVANALKSSGIGLTVIGQKPYINESGQLNELAKKSGGGGCLDIKNNFSQNLLGLAETISVGGGGLAGVEWRWLQVGSNSFQSVPFPIFGLDCWSLEIENISVETREKASTTIEKADNAIEKVSRYRSEYGALQNRLEHTINNVTNTSLNLSESESKIRDTNMADEMVQFSSNNILQQAGQAMLAQVSRSNNGILALLNI